MLGFMMGFLQKFVNVLVGTASNTAAIAIIAPLPATIFKVLTFPNRHFVFNAIDNITVSHIRFFSMRGSSNNYYSTFTNCNNPGTMLCQGYMQVPFMSGFIQNFSHQFRG